EAEEVDPVDARAVHVEGRRERGGRPDERAQVVGAAVLPPEGVDRLEEVLTGERLLAEPPRLVGRIHTHDRPEIGGPESLGTELLPASRVPGLPPRRALHGRAVHPRLVLLARARAAFDLRRTLARPDLGAATPRVVHEVAPGSGHDPQADLAAPRLVHQAVVPPVEVDAQLSRLAGIE